MAPESVTHSPNANTDRRSNKNADADPRSGPRLSLATIAPLHHHDRPALRLAGTLVNTHGCNSLSRRGMCAVVTYGVTADQSEEKRRGSSNVLLLRAKWDTTPQGLTEIVLWNRLRKVATTVGLQRRCLEAKPPMTAMKEGVYLTV